MGMRVLWADTGEARRIGVLGHWRGAIGLVAISFITATKASALLLRQLVTPLVPLLLPPPLQLPPLLLVLVLVLVLLLLGTRSPLLTCGCCGCGGGCGGCGECGGGCCCGGCGGCGSCFGMPGSQNVSTCDGNGG